MAARRTGDNDTDRQLNVAAVRRYKARQKQRGRVRLDVWVSVATMERLRALRLPFDPTLGHLVDRLVRTRKSARANFRSALRAIDAPQ